VRFAPVNRQPLDDEIMEAFATFLRESMSRRLVVDGVELPVFTGAALVSEQDILSAESSLNCPLPASYKTFVLTCGSGEWCGDFVASPAAVYSFDDCGEMTGFLPLVHNVAGVGDFVAMNPTEHTAPNEWALYYCSHDPFGYGRVANSFEQWARESLAAMEAGEYLYAKATPSVEKTWREYRTCPRRWWQFWR
jgi:hypothetical protein